MGKDLRSRTCMSAPSTLTVPKALSSWDFSESFPIYWTWRILSYSLKVQLKCFTLPVKSSWLPQTNAVILLSVPQQHFIKHRNYNLSLFCSVNITHQAIGAPEAVLYSFLFLRVRASNIVGTEWMNEWINSWPSRVPKAMAFCRKIHVQLMKPTHLKTNRILAIQICITPLLTFSNIGMRELFPWLPSRNDNANAADIPVTAKQIKLAFNLTSTVTKLMHQTWRLLKNTFKTVFWPFPSSAYKRIQPERMIVLHFKPSL